MSLRSVRPSIDLLRTVALASLLAIFIAACGSSGGSSTTTTTEVPETPPTENPSDPDPDPGEPTNPADPEDPTCDITFDSTFEAIQSTVFERRGCTAEACHGSAASGGLDLSQDVAYANLFEAPSAASPLQRVYPGTKERSFLWWKLLAATDDTVEIAGSPMPLSAEPLTVDELELVRVWILAGAPETGTVLDSDGLVDGCLPDAEPIVIEPLDPPAPGEGVQLVMPPYPLYASSEVEVCFASYYDFTDQVPDEFKSEDGQFFLYDRWEIRQDPSSHHLLVQASAAALQGQPVDPYAVSGWACIEGDREGEACDPVDQGSCGEGGFCVSPREGTTACGGYSAAPTIQTRTFSATQQAQFRVENHPGVFEGAPIKGLIFWNSHAFNLTTADTSMHARVNYWFAEDLDYPLRNYGGFNNGFGIPDLIANGAAPYTEEEFCRTTVLPKGARVTGINSHTHKRGKRFTYTLPDGTMIYESLVYNDPLQIYFDPPLEFDGTRRERRIEFCSLYNNGVDDEGNPDPESVTRASRIPYGVGGPESGSGIGLCEPTRCVNAGMYDVDCDDGVRNQSGDDAACDSSPGAGDGFCDACQIMGGVTTENEMFGPSIDYFVVDVE